MNERLRPIFKDYDGAREILVTGPGAGDLVHVDVATGALALRNAIEQEGLKARFDLVADIDGTGVISFATPRMQERFDQLTGAVSRDPRAPSRPDRPVGRSAPGAGSPGRPAAEAANPQRNADADQRVDGAADQLMATIGRVGRAIEDQTVRVLAQFRGLDSHLPDGGLPTPRAGLVFGAIGRLLRAGVGHPESRVIVTAGPAASERARQLLAADDHGASPWVLVEVPLPSRSEIETFLKGEKSKQGLVGDVPATAAMLAQRGHSLARISETIRGLVRGGDRELASLIGAESDPEKLKIVKSQLDAMVGLTELKSQLETLVREAASIQHALRLGQTTDAPATHMALLGRPGTGKTEVARIIARLLHAAGVRRSDACVCVTTAELISAYNPGHTIQNMRDALDRASDGVLFIDEAYALAESAWGRQAIDSLIGAMEERRGTVTVILAGYPDRMQRLFESNEGLKSRLPYVFRLPDYTGDELCEIFDRMLRRHKVEAEPPALAKAHAIIRREATRPHSNGRDVRNLYESCNKQRLAANARTLGLSHIVDPRSPSRSGAEHFIRQFRERFSGLDDVVRWMNDYVLTSFDALENGRLPRCPRLIFAGRPGTGKTETARQVGEFLRVCGMLRDGRVVEASLKDFSAPHVGGAAANTERILRDSAECVLFIDEVYAFAEDPQGPAILTQIVAALTNPEYHNVAVIIAGYADRMHEVYNLNSGLKDRFDDTLHFEWPDSPTLADIAIRCLASDKGKTVDERDRGEFRSRLAQLLEERRSAPGFAGARSAKTVADEVNANRARRGETQPLAPEDIPAPPAHVGLSEHRNAFLQEFPGADAASEVLTDIIATVYQGRSLSAALGLCVTGGPGSGKSTLVNWVMQRLKSSMYGPGCPIQTQSAQALQGVHLGVAQQNVRDAFHKSRGGFLFLDGFDALEDVSGGTANQYSHAAIQELTQQMSDPSNCKTVVVVAGSPNPMETMFARHPGLASRFSRFELPTPGHEDLARAAYAVLSRKHSPLPLGEYLVTLLRTHFAEDGRRRGGTDGFHAVGRLVAGIEKRAMRRTDGLWGKSSGLTRDDILGALLGLDVPPHGGHAAGSELHGG